jgi:hypothetical protein
MCIETDIYINQLAQNIIPQQEGNVWFGDLTPDGQLDVLRRIVFFILQAGARGIDVESAINDCKLKSTYTPCQLLLKAFKQEPEGNKLLSTQLSKLVNLPVNERHKSFVLLISLFRLAEQKKREKGLKPDKYWWHRDLSNEQVINEIISEHVSG